MPPFPFESPLLLDAIPYFWSCQYWAGVVQNAIGCTIGSFVAILVSYWIYRRTTRNDRRNRANEAKDVLLYFKQTMETIIRIAKDQTANVQRYCDDIEENDLELPYLSFLPMYSLKRIAEGTSLDRTLVAYIRQFPSESNVKEFEALISAVEYFLAQFLLLPEEMRSTRLYDHERKTQYQKIYKEAYDLLGFYIMTNDPALQTEFGQHVGDLIEELRIHHIDNYDIFTTIFSLSR
jgi:hypothetical protein